MSTFATGCQLIGIPHVAWRGWLFAHVVDVGERVAGLVKFVCASILIPFEKWRKSQDPRPPSAKCMED